MNEPETMRPDQLPKTPLHAVQVPEGMMGAFGDAGYESIEELSPADAAAVDAMIEAGLNPTAVSEARRPRAARVLDLFSLLQVPGPGDAEGALVDVTLARVARVHAARARSPLAPTHDDQLSPEDDDALEALVAAGMNAAKTPTGVRKRARHQLDLLNLLEPTQAELGDEEDRRYLIARTLASAQSAVDATSSRMKIQRRSLGEGWGSRWVRPRLADLVSVAALLAIGTAIISPMLGGIREFSRQVACRSNMNAAGLAFGAYANDNQDAVPMASASLAGTPWWSVGRTEHSNSANLYTLARTKYEEVKSFACAGNAKARCTEDREGAMDWGCLDEVSYSYQNMFAIERPRWSSAKAGAGGVSGRWVVLVDHSPVVPRALRRELIDPSENSSNHGGFGQNVLFSDGSVVWVSTPVLSNGDNIWLPRFLEECIARYSNPTRADPLMGTETPDDANDAFVGP